jgi:hypothetical protein
MPVGTTPKNRRSGPKPSAGALPAIPPTPAGPRICIDTRTDQITREGPSEPLGRTPIADVCAPISRGEFCGKDMQRNDLYQQPTKLALPGPETAAVPGATVSVFLVHSVVLPQHRAPRKPGDARRQFRQGGTFQPSPAADPATGNWPPPWQWGPWRPTNCDR